jgi:hypothetical protein
LQGFVSGSGQAAALKRFREDKRNGVVYCKDGKTKKSRCVAVSENVSECVACGGPVVKPTVPDYVRFPKEEMELATEDDLDVTDAALLESVSVLISGLPSTDYGSIMATHSETKAFGDVFRLDESDTEFYSSLLSSAVAGYNRGSYLGQKMKRKNKGGK